MEPHKHNFLKTKPFSRILFSVASLTLVSNSQLIAELEISNLSISDNQVIMTVEGLNVGEQPFIQAVTELSNLTALTPFLTNAVPVDNGGGVYTVTIARPADLKVFFRAVAGNLGTASDLDGDGLPNQFETDILGTDPNSFDSDGDGFSDGLEFSSGTNPDSASDFPDLLTLPTVAFQSGMSQATEGENSFSIQIFGEQSYSGPIFYSINARSTATSPEDFTLSEPSSVMMTNGVAQLPITLIDDLEISPERLIVIDLEKNPPGNFYRAAGAVAHVVCLSENDSYWNGVAVDNASQRNFRMRLLRNASTTQCAFVSGNQDGLNTESSDGTDLMGTSQTTGLIPDVDIAGTPQSVWQATPSVFTSTSFQATSPEMPVLNSGFTNQPLVRTLALDAEIEPIFRLLAPPNNTLRSTEPSEPLVFAGSYVETISHATDPSITYLNSTINGSFSLTRVQSAQVNLSSAYQIDLGN